LLRTKDHSISYEAGDLVKVAGYDRYLRFSVTDPNGQNFIWGVEPRALQLLEVPPTLREKIVTCVVRAGLTPKKWLSASTVAVNVGESREPVARLLKDMYLRGELDVVPGRVPLYSANLRVLVPTRYDRLIVGWDQYLG
jgi:hypothetical protein